MRWREFIGLFGVAAATWPLVVYAQQPATPVIGFMHGESLDAIPRGQLAAFHLGLKENGYVEGQNLTIEYRWAEGHPDRLPAQAADLVRRRVAAIVTLGGAHSILAAQNATTDIPIVFNTGADPLKMKLVASLNRPGGNTTGSSFFAEELGSKGLGLLHEIVPAAKTIGLMINPSNPETPRQSADVMAAAQTLGLTLVVVNAATPADVDRAFETLAERRVDALHLLGDAFLSTRMQQIVEHAARHRLPTMYYRREYVEAGGLVSYGTSVIEAYRQTAFLVGRVLKGNRPADLPVMQSTKFEFTINLRTARSLGIDIPGTISARADDVIE